MASNKRFLKAYARFDGSGRIVPASTILRKTKPKVGNWTEVQTYECCNQDQYDLFTAPQLPITWPVAVFFCNGEGLPISNGFPGTYATLGDLVDALNTELGSTFGVFSVINDGVKLTVSAAFKNEHCPNGILTYEIIPD